MDIAGISIISSFVIFLFISSKVRQECDTLTVAALLNEWGMFSKMLHIKNAD